MNKLIDGTEYRPTINGYVLKRGNRELHIIAKSADQSARAKNLIATVSFDRLVKASKNVHGINCLRLK